MSDKEYLEKCRSGIYPLQTILTTRNDGFDAYLVVRWCPVCGAVVVDLEYDNRTYSGRVVRMKLPKITQEEARM